MEIRLAGPADVEGMVQVMVESVEALPHPDWFVSDDGAFIRRQIEEEGFGLVAEEDGGMAGFLVVRIPGQEEENLGHYLSVWQEMMECGKEEGARALLERVAHFESACVRPPCRGRRLQARLFTRALEVLASPEYGRIAWCMGTVHPDNQASMKSFLRNGFEVLEVVKKYGGLDRCVMCRQIRP